jgi:hypothetical protein
MKRLFLGASMLVAAPLLWGCPVYPQDCSGYGGSSLYFTTNGGCAQGYACSSEGNCMPLPGASGTAGGEAPDSGADAVADAEAEGEAEAEAEAAVDGSVAVDSATAGDAGDESFQNGGACNADGDCGGQGGSRGARCVDGICTSQVGLCSDATQCRASGSSCVDGLCEATCSATAPCPAGYGCDFTHGVCNLNPGACAGSGASTCQGGATCAEGHCVPPCGPSDDAGPSCAQGQVCVNGGCIPDQAAVFACDNDGDQGPLANACPAESICLHHDCYAACVMDGGAPCGGSSECKDVTIETGTYAVCAAAETLGSECDGAQGQYCSTGLCINGSCR